MPPNISTNHILFPNLFRNMRMTTCITNYSFRVSEQGTSGRQFHNPHS